MPTEPFPLAITEQILHVFRHPLHSQNLLLRLDHILIDNHIVQEETTNVFIVDAPQRGVLGPILARVGPEMGLW